MNIALLYFIYSYHSLHDRHRAFIIYILVPGPLNIFSVKLESYVVVYAFAPILWYMHLYQLVIAVELLDSCQMLTCLAKEQKDALCPSYKLWYE